MRRFVKWLFALLVVACIVGLAGLFSQMTWVPWLTPTVNQWIREFPWLREVFLNLLILLTAFFFILFVFLAFLPTERRRIVYKKEIGTIKVSKAVIETIVKNACRPVIDPEKLRIKVKLKGNNHVLAHVVFHVRNPHRFNEMGQELHTRITHALQKNLPDEKVQVDVVLQEVETNETSLLNNKRRVI